MLRQMMFALAVLLAGSHQARAGETLQPPKDKPALSAAVPISSGASCAAACQSAHDICRIRRKGSPSCDAERQACLTKCLQQKRR